MLRRRILRSFVRIYIEYKINVNFYADNIFRTTENHFSCILFISKVPFLLYTQRGIYMWYRMTCTTHPFAVSVYDLRALIANISERSIAQHKTVAESGIKVMAVYFHEQRSYNNEPQKDLQMSYTLFLCII